MSTVLAAILGLIVTQLYLPFIDDLPNPLNFSFNLKNGNDNEALGLSLPEALSLYHENDVTCETALSDLAPGKKSSDDITFAPLRAWVRQIKEDECARNTISKYPPLQDVERDFPSGGTLSQIQIANKAAATLAALKDALGESSFYDGFTNRVLNGLPDVITNQNAGDLNFTISRGSKI